MSENPQPFNPRLVIGLIAAGAATFIVLLLLLAYGPQLGSGRPGQADATSRAATGFKGLVDLVGGVREAHLDDDRGDWADHLLVVTLEPEDGPADIGALLEQRGDNPTLLILPKWITVRDPVRRDWVRAVAPGVGTSLGPAIGKGMEVSIARESASGSVEGMGRLAGLRIPIPRSAQTIEGPDLQPLAALPGGGALVAQLGYREHFVVADPDLLNNQALRDRQRAQLAFELVDRLNDGREFLDFDLTLNGRSEGAAGPNILRLAFEPPFLAMTLALAFAALMAGLHGAFRFGPVRREERAIAFGKAALVDNAAGLIRLAGREARLGRAYVDLIRQDAARATGAAQWLREDELDAYLERLGKPDRPGFRELAARLDAARDRYSLVGAAHALFQWKKEVIR